MDTADLEIQYRDQHLPIYASLAARIASLLTRLLKEHGISVFQIEHRPKTVESFLTKVRHKTYDQPFDQIKDFAGIRVVTYYNDDVEKVAAFVRVEFNVDPDHSTDKVEELNVDEFGYRSFHLVCNLKPPRCDLAEWKDCRSLAFEIQVRSVLQHAWAAISHKLDYKSAAQAPREVRRQLFRLSALLELADDQFAQVRDRTDKIVERYREEVDRGDLDIPLNVDSLTEYLRERVDFERWTKLGVEAGMRKSTEPSQESSKTQHLFETLAVLRMDTISDLDNLIATNDKAAPQILRSVAEASEKHGYLMYAVAIDILHAFILIAAKKHLPNTNDWGTHFAHEIIDAIREIIGMPQAERSKTS